MSKKLIGIVVIAIMLFGVLGLVGCDSFNLTKYKASGCAAIETYAAIKIAESNYSEAGLQAIEQVVNECKAAVDTAENKTAVDTAVSDAKITIDVAQKEGEVAEWTLLDSSNCYAEFEQSEAYFENIAKSTAAYDEAIAFFTTTDGKYTDDFGGVFIDGNGIYNICVVGNREPVKSDFLIYKQVENSLNFLNSVFDELGSVPQQFTIWMVGVCENSNSVVVCIESINKIPLIISHLKTNSLFNTETMKFFIGENDIALN